MSQPFLPEKVLFFFGLLYRKDIFLKKDLETLLNDEFGPGEYFECDELKFNLVNYYEKEMGNQVSLRRGWYFNSKPLNRNLLVDYKLKANEIEATQMKAFGLKGRCINIDPGFVGLEQVILSTGKPFSHRIYLDNGIYAELTYLFKDKHWNELPWTYPDYRELVVKNRFIKQRNLLKGSLK